MADDADRTADRQEREYHFLRLASLQPTAPEPAGHCLFCGEETAERWCSTECRDDYERENRGRRIAGR